MAGKMSVQGNEIRIISREREDYISLTDIAKYRNADDPYAIINNWMRSRSTIDFLGLWKKLSNVDFKPLEFERFRNDAGTNHFVYLTEAASRIVNACCVRILGRRRPVSHFSSGFARMWVRKLGL